MYLTAREKFSDVAWRQGDSPLGHEARYWRGMTWIYSIRGTTAVEPDSIRNGLWLIKQVSRNALEPDLRGMVFNSIAEIYLALGRPDSALVYAGQVLEAPYLEDHHPRAFALQLSEDQERAVQARIDTMRSTGVAMAAPSGMGEGNWTVQVGSYREMRNATETVLNLTGEKYPAWHKSELVRGVLYVRVYVGRFHTRVSCCAECSTSGSMSDGSRPVARQLNLPGDSWTNLSMCRIM